MELSEDEWAKAENGNMFDDFDINDELMADIGNFANMTSIKKSVNELLST
jgi:hypothetical protein